MGLERAWQVVVRSSDADDFRPAFCCFSLFPKRRHCRNETKVTAVTTLARAVTLNLCGDGNYLLWTANHKSRIGCSSRKGQIRDRSGIQLASADI